jgi:hypothetical protein
MAADETTLIESWLYATLAADSTLTALLGRYTDPTGVELGPSIHSAQAKKGTAYPAVIFRWLPGGIGDAYYNGARRMWSGSFYQIMAVDERSDYEGLSAIASRIDTLLSINTVIPVTGGNINQCIRIHPDKRPRFEGAGQEFRELGAFWDIVAQAV